MMPPPAMDVPSAMLAALPKLHHHHHQRSHHILSATTTRLPLLFLVLFSCMLDSTLSERDFNFNDSQVPLLEPKDAPKHVLQNLHPYVAELSRCHYADSEIILSLVLQDHDWNTMNPNKKSKVLAKLAKFFAIPKEFIMLDNVGKHELYIMQKESLRKGNNKCHKQRQIGRASFVLGCGTTYFSMAEPIVNQIGQQIKDGSIDNISGEHFGWWVIWHRSVEMRAHRTRREATEGSGEDEYDESYDYDGEDEEEPAESVTEIPDVRQHAHRHHHGDVSEPDLNERKFVGSETGVDGAIHSNAIPKVEEASERNLSVLNKAKNSNLDEEIVESVSQLESVISKTIENTKHIKDVVILPTDDVNSSVVDIEKELESTRILEEIQDELARKNNEAGYTTTPIAITTTIMQTSELKPSSTTSSLTSAATRAATTTTTAANQELLLSNSNNKDSNYDDNLDDVDDDDDEFDNLDTVYESESSSGNRNSINTVNAPAVDVVAQVIESATVLSTVTRAHETTAHTDNNNNNIATKIALATVSSSVETITLPTQTQTPKDTTIIPISQMPPLQSPDSSIYDTSSIHLSQSNIPHFSSSSSSSSLSSSTPSSLSSSTLTPLLPITITSSSSSSSSFSSSMLDVTMIPSSTPSSYSAILTTIEPNKHHNSFVEEIETIQPSILHAEEENDLIEIIVSTATISTTEKTATEAIPNETLSSSDEKPLVVTTQATTMKSNSTITTPNDIDDANNSRKAKENESDPTLSMTQDNVTSLSSSGVASTASSDVLTTPISTNVSSTPKLLALTTPTPPSTDYVEPHNNENIPPIIKTRLPKITVIAGKYFVSPVPENIFYDNEDQTNLRLEFTDKEGREVKRTSWIQFNSDTREIYGLPVFDTVAKYFYYLRATDSGNETVTETVEIKVQQHRFERSFNHEINITVKINEKSLPSVDWQIKLIKGVAATLGDETTDAIVVREIPQMRQDPNTATFAYFNETFSTSVCPESELNDVVRRLDASRLTDFVQPILGIKSITGQLIGTCRKVDLTPTKPPAIITKNLPPVPRNQVDHVNATVGHLLVFRVPSDTFYDANDNQLTLSLKTKENKEISQRHWLQFDSKNEEFYGIPKSADIGTEEYLLIAEDSGGLTATDALVVVVSHAPKREFSVYFKAYLAIRHEQFNANLQRKFVESISHIFGDRGTHYVQIRSVTTHHDSDGTIVNFYNTTLYKSHNRCPEEEIDAARSVYLMSDNTVRERVKKTLGPELNLTNVQVITLGSCHPQTDITHREYIPPKNDEPLLKSTFADDYFYTFILPTVIIVIMIVVSVTIACCLHRRRHKSGKMELGDEEERKSFRTKGIPVIFQDELDEKPEIGNKSPIILKDEKPPLLPPSYNTSNMNGDNDVDEYVPPPAVIVGGREARGKSPATPSYRKPPPYVSP